jgi:Helix-turn-helix domain
VIGQSETVVAMVEAQAAAEMLGVQVSTLAAWRCRKKGPPYLKVGKGVRYRVADLNAWIEASRIMPEAG